MMNSPRYFVGRQILIKQFIESEGEEFVTHEAAIVDVNMEQGKFLISAESDMEVDMKDVFELNQPHVFAKDIVGNLIFEDGLTCDYRSGDVKLKLAEICYKLAPLIEKLDFTADPTNIQLECIRVIRSCLNFITFDEGNVKAVQYERHRTGTTGKLALFGQGSCHGCSSVMASFLYPFSNILGIDLKYREGTCGKRNNNVAEHQWLELTCRPSMQTFTCDLWFEGVHQEPSWLTQPADNTYAGTLYPNGKLILGTKSQPVQESDIQKN